MVRKIECKKCEAASKKMFPTESPYPGEHVKFVTGTANKNMICDHCGKRITKDEVVCAFSIFTDRTPYMPWEEEFVTPLVS
jgi:hypothetical protein